MNKLASLCCTLLLSASVAAPMLAHASVEGDMKAMSKALRAASSASDAAGMKAGLADLKNATLKAKTEVPGGLKDQATDSPARKTYTEGLDNVIKQVDDANALIDAGKLDEAKAAIKEINTTRKTYHKKLGV